MTVTRDNPNTVAPPLGAYSHVTIVPPGSRLLVLAGQVGNRPDGSLPEDVDAQFLQALDNVVAIVRAHGATPADIARMTMYLTSEPRDRQALTERRKALFGATLPANTLVFVSALADPKFKVEIEAIAAVPA